MTLFDLMGLASKVPFELIQKLEADLPKFQQLMDLEKEAEPHVTALIPIMKDAQTVWNSISPDVLSLVSTFEKGTP